MNVSRSDNARDALSCSSKGAMRTRTPVLSAERKKSRPSSSRNAPSPNNVRSPFSSEPPECSSNDRIPAQSFADSNADNRE